MKKSNGLHLLLGTLFGVGLAVSDMMNPARVIAFLDITGEWDPTLLFVMGGALLVSFPLHHVLRRKRGSDYGGALPKGSAVKIDRPLIVGAALFGVGWGMSGICPGPAITQLAFPGVNGMLFLGALITGMLLHRVFAGVLKTKRS